MTVDVSRLNAVDLVVEADRNFIGLARRSYDGSLQYDESVEELLQGQGGEQLRIALQVMIDAPGILTILIDEVYRYKPE